jgi:hypothetical protein
MSVATFLVTLLTAAPSSDDPGDSSVDIEKQRSKAVTKMALETAQACKVILDDANGERLKLHPNPILRWSNPTVGSVYGEVFVEGTDPEVWLMTETRMSDDKSVWHFALARMNRDEIRVTYQDKEVWRAPSTSKPWGNLLSPYALFMIRKGWH